MRESAQLSDRMMLDLARDIRGTNPISGHLTIKVEYRDGQRELRELPNTVVFDGEDLAAQLLRDANAQPITALAIGTSGAAVSKADSLLLAEITTGGGARAAASAGQGSHSNEAVFEHQWTFSGTHAIREAGLFNTTAGNSKTMFARQVFAVINVVSDDKLTLSWTVTAGTAR